MKLTHRFGPDFSRFRSPLLWTPNGNVGATNSDIGPPLTQEGTVTYPAPANALGTYMRRGNFANAGGVINQVVGLRYPNVVDHACMRGNTTGIGGFYLSMRFSLVAWPADTARLFAGISASTANVAATDFAALPNDTLGIMHDSADGANVLWFVQKAGAGAASRVAITGGEGNPTIATGQSFWLEMWAQSFNTARVILWDLTASKSLCFNLSGAPVETVFAGPQCVASNGTTAGNIVQLGVQGLYQNIGDELDLR